MVPLGRWMSLASQIGQHRLPCKLWLVCPASTSDKLVRNSLDPPIPWTLLSSFSHVCFRPNCCKKSSIPTILWVALLWTNPWLIWSLAEGLYRDLSYTHKAMPMCMAPSWKLLLVTKNHNQIKAILSVWACDLGFVRYNLQIIFWIVYQFLTLAFYFYLFGREHATQPAGSWFLDQGSNQHPLQG